MKEQQYGSLKWSWDDHQGFIDGKWLRLTARETQVLEMMLHAPGTIVSKRRIDERATSNAAEVHIHALRRKLKPANLIIETVRGLGYLIKEGPLLRSTSRSEPVIAKHIRTFVCDTGAFLEVQRAGNLLVFLEGSAPEPKQDKGETRQ